MSDSDKEPCGCQCTEVQGEMSELFDAALSPQECEALRQKIASCPECFSRLEREEAIRALMRSCCGADHAPVMLRQKITAQIRIVRG
ncbi:mycothiol system anti-sigma-R factor [Corynebacterium lowii]|uniref:Anti-sigma factor RsrA n=1 Tax=Corynebacterium lowii TaxID=1544413 RepID=A0A0Q0YKU1_9CORY|nr:mycothiol system anti-sigma-R factor [Corynebacterium lowii]KQB87559.1 Anti-sigma factor RsrA [Corynebacterium lowii]MDP9851846.1 mycothiol system anti-sigma-R factor [Corynebacterium lowii]